MSGNRLLETLSIYQKKIEKAIEQELYSQGEHNTLWEACRYSLVNGGKRFRPALVFMIAEALEKGFEVSHAAVAVEFFHTASLIADDLPCMDDEQERRHKPALHKVYGEATAILASYALIAAGYGAITKNGQQLFFKLGERAHLLCTLAVENISYNSGLLGATGGQFLDLYPSQINGKNIREIICKKTVSLFEISFVLGWLFGGGDPEKLDLVKRAALHFGMAFQIADDLDDIDQDQQKGRSINSATIWGASQAKEVLEEEIALFLDLLAELRIKNPELSTLIQSLL